MKKIHFLFFLCFSLILLYSSPTQKEQQIYDKISEYGNFNVDKFDNFVGYGGSEYVIVYIKNSPFFLFNISKENHSDSNYSNYSYKITLIDDNATIDTVLSYRASILFSIQPIGDVLDEVWPKIDKFKQQVAIKEIKYLYLTGLLNKSCDSIEECKDICLSWSTCSMFYSFNSSELLDSILEFSKAKTNLADLFEKEKLFRTQIREKKDEEILFFYLDFFKSLNNSIITYSNLKIQKETSLFYAGPLSFQDTQEIPKTMSLIWSYYKNYSIKKEFDFIANSIKKNTNLYAKPKSVIEKYEQPITPLNYSELENSEKDQDNYSLVQESRVLLSDQKRKKGEEDFYAPISKNLDFILVVIALTIIIYSFGTILFPKILGFIKPEQRSHPNKERKLLFSEVFKKFKKNKTLEDL